VQRKQKLLHGKRERKLAWFIACAVVVAFLTLVPLPLRIEGAAVIGPQHIGTIAAPVEGNVGKVFAREGQRVTAGQVLGGMDDWAWKAELASAQSKYQSAVLAIEGDLAERSPKA
jgi:multidrug efflux pump subunit AcrA (membrane-fusion protein)